MIVSKQIDEMVKILEKCVLDLKNLKERADDDDVKQDKILSSLNSITDLSQEIKEAVV